MYTPSPERLALLNEFGRLIDQLKDPRLDPPGMRDVIKGWGEVNQVTWFEGGENKYFTTFLEPFTSHPRQRHHIKNLLEGGRFNHPVIAAEAVHNIDAYHTAFHRLPLAAQTEDPSTPALVRTGLYVIPKPREEDIEIDGIRYPQVLVGYSADGRPANPDKLVLPYVVAALHVEVGEANDGVEAYPDVFPYIVIDREGNSRPTSLVFMNRNGYSFRGSVRFKISSVNMGQPSHRGTITDTLMY